MSKDAQLIKLAQITGHSRYDEKDGSGRITRTSYTVDACFEMGKLPVRLYIPEDDAKNLVKETGNSFDFETIRQNGFKPYKAEVGLSVYTGENITERNGRQRASGVLKTACDYVTKAA